MYKTRRQPQTPQRAVCKECGSTRVLFRYGKIYCNNCGALIVSGVSKNKYNAKRTKALDGQIRDSKFEALVADTLFQRKQAGEIKNYESQYRVEMWAYDENGKKAMKKSHKVDFRIEHLDGSFELYEAKGIETQDYKDRRKWLETFWLPFHPDHTYTVVFQKDFKKRY